MLQFLSKNKWRILFMAILCGGIMASFQYALTPDKTLPILQPDKFDPTLVDDSMLFVKKYHKIAPFQLVNQNGDTITDKDYDNKIYVSDFFFTTCPTICPVMTKNMTLVQEEFKNDPDVMILSHSVTPEIDSVEVLKKYAVKKGVMDSKWNLVTGDRKQIYDLARKSYLAAKENKYGGDYALIHTENFLLVDKEGRLRGRSYDGTSEEDVLKLIEDIYILKSTYVKDR
ncbi:protein SCO1/2 [Nonlabens xylanidelens]|uniref:Protein SCO1/2 n=1 Tax=Nonlabens xylanidelens TaxID=191564 RepID=A0A2S6IQG9_9FLAO|nr:SCO family protein [Nonlabens xylanidelens]PPK96502.1 protein SCO1/2 [Nonlabens xylanidelens]PQJ18220.1 SCO family protein [Nonlabens xylanidelens]